MRITRATLLKNANMAVDQMLQRDRHLICVYLTGSLLLDEPLLGGTTDIDLFVVHDHEPAVGREIIRLTDDVHLDIAHYSQETFHRTRHLRFDPWMGSFLCHNPIVLHDVQHWFEFTQASTCAQFMDPENLVRRVSPLVESARAYWFGINAGGFASFPEQLSDYLKSLETAANAVAVLSGAPPLTERRFLLNFPEYAKAVGYPELVPELVELFADKPVEDEALRGWLAAWRETFLSAGKQPDCPPRLHPCRLPYYEKAVSALNQDHPAAALWLLLRTWTQAISVLSLASPSYQFWLDACQMLELDKEHLPERMGKLDAYLDSIEEMLDSWASDNGVGPITNRQNR